MLPPITRTRRPLIETPYVDPNYFNYNQPTTTVHPPVFQQPESYPQLPQFSSNQPPVFQQPESQPQLPQVQYHYYQPYNMHPYHVQPSFGYQWQNTVQPANTNVVPCTNPQHYGGYQQYGYWCRPFPKGSNPAANLPWLLHKSKHSSIILYTALILRMKSLQSPFVLSAIM